MDAAPSVTNNTARWLALVSAAGFTVAVGLLPWAQFAGTVVGEKDFTFWDVRPGLEQLDGLWSMLGAPFVLIAVALVCAWIVSACAGTTTEKIDRAAFLMAATVPGLWAALVIVQINDAVSESNRLGLGNALSFRVGFGAWAALASGAGILAAAYTYTPAESVAP